MASNIIFFLTLFLFYNIITVGKLDDKSFNNAVWSEVYD